MDTQTQARIKTLLHKYLRNACTPAEVEELFAYSKAYPENQLWSEAIDMEAEQIGQEQIAVPPEVSAALRSQILREIGRKSHPPVYKLYAWQIAASFLFALACFSLWFLLPRSLNEVVVRTSFGEIRHVVLPDSSLVVLNANSILKYKTSWNSREVRKVHLQGEGFFKVVHKANHQKFEVHTSTCVRIDVLGTEFNVNDRRQRTQVTLQSGKIAVDLKKNKTPGSNPDMTMKPGEYILVDGSHRITRKSVNAETYTSWKSNRFVFNETPLREILYALEDQYGTTVIVKDSAMLHETFTATYPSDNKEILLKALTKSFGIVYDSANNLVMVKPGSTSAQE